MLCCLLPLSATAQAYSLIIPQFAFNSALLDEDNQRVLDSYAELIHGALPYRFTLQGHTCNIGPEAYNRELSLKRAEAVKAYLVGKGVPEQQIRVEGLGSSEPKYDNATPEGRRLNRRVEFVP